MADVTFTVTVSNSKFYLGSQEAPAISLDAGKSYKFDQSDSSNSGHPLLIKDKPSGTQWTTGVTTSGTPGSDGYTEWVVAGAGYIPEYWSGTEGTTGSEQVDHALNFLYYCGTHGESYGNTIHIGDADISGTITYQQAYNGGILFTSGGNTAHNMPVNTPIRITENGTTLPGGASEGVTYYVMVGEDAPYHGGRPLNENFYISASSGGSAVSYGGGWQGSNYLGAHLYASYGLAGDSDTYNPLPATGSAISASDVAGLQGKSLSDVTFSSLQSDRHSEDGGSIGNTDVDLSDTFGGNSSRS